MNKNFKNVKLYSFSRKKKKSNFKKYIFILLIIAFSFSSFLLIYLWFWFNINILKELPDVKKLETFEIYQASIITDRNWEVLYRLFYENREYVKLNEISNNVINAFVAAEDKNFWTNPWIDIVWILRAWINEIFNRWKSRQWWSTITQQLIKNIFLTREKTIKRKLKELVLTFNLNNYLEEKIKKENPWINSEEIEKRKKEYILELYLNYIFLGNNSYWVESASKTYFNKKSKDLDILESSILASIPKAPSLYDPIRKPWEVIWYFEIEKDWNKGLYYFNQNKIISWLNIEINKELVYEKIYESINESSFTFKKSENAILSSLRWILTFEIDWVKFKYIPWRKDYVLSRLYTDWYINQSIFKETFLSWFNVIFHKQKLEIKAPHFVFFVIDQLKKKYWDKIYKWWLIIKTTLDYRIQQLAEKSLKETKWNLEKYDANNAALLYIDTSNWDILAYVWSLDYYDSNIDWQVDMIQSLRQPWSTMKPFVYAFSFMKFPFTIDHPIFDNPVNFWDYKPLNADWTYMWLMQLKTALPYSRNIPAIKLLYLIWLKDFILFLNKIWIDEVKLDNINKYWLSLAIGWTEVTMYSLAKWYTHLTNNPVEIDPILEIKDKNWNIIYKKINKQLERIIPKDVVYIIWHILSTIDYLPPSWRNNYNYKPVKFALKSWTTDVKIWWERFPRDWRLVAYTPSKLLILWAWNTNWKPMKKWAFWWWLNWQTWKIFANYLVNNWFLKNEEMQEQGIWRYYINKYNWKKICIDSHLEFAVYTIWRLNIELECDDTKLIKIDKLCNWLANENTPLDEQIDWYIISPRDVVPYDKHPENYWSIINLLKDNLTWNIFLFDWPKDYCNRNFNIDLKTNLKNQEKIYSKFDLLYNVNSNVNIKKVSIKANNNLIYEKDYNKNNISEYVKINIPFNWDVQIKLEVLTDFWVKDFTYNVIVVEKDEDVPYLGFKEINEFGEIYQIKLFFYDKTSSLKWWKIYYGDTSYEFSWNLLKLEIPKNINKIYYEIYDEAWNKWEWEVLLNNF